VIFSKVKVHNIKHPTVAKRERYALFIAADIILIVKINHKIIMAN
jgi:hypothetical protein